MVWGWVSIFFFFRLLFPPPPALLASFPRAGRCGRRQEGAEDGDGAALRRDAVTPGTPGPPAPRRDAVKLIVPSIALQWPQGTTGTQRGPPDAGEAMDAGCRKSSTQKTRWRRRRSSCSGATPCTATSRRYRREGQKCPWTQRSRRLSRSRTAPGGRWGCAWPSSGTTSTGGTMRSSVRCSSPCSPPRTTPTSTSPGSRPATLLFSPLCQPEAVNAPQAACSRVASTGAGWLHCWALATAWPSTSTSRASRASSAASPATSQTSCCRTASRNGSPSREDGWLHSIWTMFT
ncbi:Bak1 isoform A [Columba livia]|nr:Bak1 isoform A [Columba livia]